MKKVKVVSTNGRSTINGMYVYIGQILWLCESGYYYYDQDRSTGFRLPLIRTIDC